MRKILRLFLLIVFLCTVTYLVNNALIQPKKLDNEQQQAKQVFYTVDQGGKSADTALEQRFSALHKINADIQGWIKVPNTNIDLPVLQASVADPEFYLSHDYQKAKSQYGSIYADANSPMLSSSAQATILYGHTLRNGRMFSELKKYKDLSFFKSNPVIDFTTSQENAKWKIISVFLTNELESQGPVFNYMRSEFKNFSDYLNFVYQLRIRSLFNTGVSFRNDDKILLLSTCSYEFDDFRLVVVARKIREGESDSINTEHISANPQTLYPDCWYKRYNTEKPAWPDRYEDAKNMISWEEN